MLWRWICSAFYLAFGLLGLASGSEIVIVLSFLLAVVVAIIALCAGNHQSAPVEASPWVTRLLIGGLWLVIACATVGTIQVLLLESNHVSGILSSGFAVIAILAARTLQLRSPRRILWFSLVTLVLCAIFLPLWLSLTSFNGWLENSWVSMFGADYHQPRPLLDSTLLLLYPTCFAFAAGLALTLGVMREDAPVLPEARLAR